MAFFKKLFKRNLTPEEQERKSREEKEWADKCYRAGERFGEKIGFSRKVEAINAFGSKYPKTFFFIIFGLVGACLVLNLMFASLGGWVKNDLHDMPQMPQVTDRAPEVISVEARKLLDEMKGLATEIDEYVKRDSLSHQDSLTIKTKLIRLQEIQKILGVNEIE